MFDWLSSETFAVLSVAALFGGMLFFSGVMAPLVFVKLPAATAGGFIRQLFPWYYLVMGTVSTAAFLLLLLSQSESLFIERFLMGIVLLGFVFARQWLMPRINHARDASSKGVSRQDIRFKRLHAVSVAVNSLQLLVCVVVLTRLI